MSAHDWQYTGADTHKGEYWFRCSRCGLKDWNALHQGVEALANGPCSPDAAPTPPVQQCRDDGRCQYAIDHGAEGMGHCPPGKCVMPAQQDDEALEVLRRIISTWESPWPPGADPMAHVLAEARALIAKRGAA